MLPCVSWLVSPTVHHTVVVNQKVTLLYWKRIPGRNNATQMNLTVLCFDNTLISLRMQTK